MANPGQEAASAEAAMEAAEQAKHGVVPAI
jgi:hypothetical protein